MSTTAVERFVAAARAQGIDPQVKMFPNDTRTAVQAAEALGCELGQIVKSLIFTADDELVLVLASGSNRVDESVAAPHFGVTTLGKADAAGVRSATGFAIGGVPPFGHPTRLRSVIDEDLLQYSEIWAAAGAPDAVFALTPAQLVELSGARFAKIAAVTRS